MGGWSGRQPSRDNRENREPETSFKQAEAKEQGPHKSGGPAKSESRCLALPTERPTLFPGLLYAQGASSRARGPGTRSSPATCTGAGRGLRSLEIRVLRAAAQGKPLQASPPWGWGKGSLYGQAVSLKPKPPRDPVKLEEGPKPQLVPLLLAWSGLGHSFLAVVASCSDPGQTQGFTWGDNF